MTNPADNPCTCRACGVLILNEVASVCEDCEAESEALREDLVNNYNDQSDRDNDAFADACSQMTQEDWDADNDWLASAGWGEM